MLRVASNALIVPPFECAWLSLGDYQLDGACCLQFDCKGENDVTIILKPFPGAKRWQHLQRQQGPAGGAQFAVEQNYTVILGSHRNSKLKIEKNGEERESATGLPGCTVNLHKFTTCWINYAQGCISVGTGPAGSALSFRWQDPEPAIPGIRNIGLSCWDKHVSYRNVQVLPPLAAAQLQQLAEQQQRLQEQVQQQQRQWRERQAAPQQALWDGPDSSNGKNLDSLAAAAPAAVQGTQQPQQDGHGVLSLLQLTMDSIVQCLSPAAVFHVLHLSELLLPRTQQLYEVAVVLAGQWFGLLVKHHLDGLAGLSVDVLADILQEPLLDVSELAVFQAVAAWCQCGSQPPCSDTSSDAAVAATAMVDVSADNLAGQNNSQEEQVPEQQHALPAQCAQDRQGWKQQQQRPCADEQMQCSAPAAGAVVRATSDVQELLQLVRFAFMPEEDRQAVLSHPFTQSCPYVQQCMKKDLQSLSESNNGSSPRGCYTFEQRRLVRPAAPGRSSVPSPAGAVVAAALSSTAAAPDSTGLNQHGPGQLGARPGAGGTGNTVGSKVGSTGGRALGWRQYRRRLAPSCAELMYVCDGDRNGVVHYIGTEYGTKQWVNPVASKALDIKASSPPSRYTDPKALVSGQFLNTSFAGPRYIRAPVQPAGPAAPGGTTSAAAAAAAASPSTWWQLDLGPQHRLLCNYYTIRHDGSNDGFVRSWVLQGSNDLQHWLDLRRHCNDATIRLPGQYGSWPITGPAASMPFRAFRLLLLGPTQSSSNPWAFCLSYWELYGYFYKLGVHKGAHVAAAEGAA